MALKETHTLNDEHTVYIRYHPGDCGDPPEPVKVLPLMDTEGRYIFPLEYGQYGPVMAKDESDYITVTFEKYND